MALTDEQRAMLQLLLEGGQGYDDIGSLLGIAPDEVRTRAREALREMGGADPDAQVALSDYLLGQADPIGRADAVRHLQNDPEANALAERLLTQLRLLAPKAELPEIPAARGGRRTAAPPPPAPAEAPAAESTSPAPPSLPAGPGFASRVAGFFSGLGGGGKRRTQLIVAGVAALALATAVVVVASGSGDDGGDKSAEDCPTVDAAQAQQAGLPVIPLEAAESPPEGECTPAGQLTLVAAKKQLGLQINAVGLKPTGQDETYIIWLYQTDEQSLPVASQASQDGNLTGNVPVSQELGGLIAGGAFSSVRVALASASEAQTLVQSQGQGKQQSPVTAFVGTTVLEGALPQPQQGQAGGGQAPQSQTPQSPQGGAGTQ